MWHDLRVRAGVNGRAEPGDPDRHLAGSWNRQITARGSKRGADQSGAALQGISARFYVVAITDLGRCLSQSAARPHR